ncbi:Superfamily II DNA or RNA helicase [Amycolatopsis arida]|uniref:Superfamily II DNA or RNA helicase n=1 Tax=Amycolatopsis arida TaxID=587909 RepID=A0A1I5YFU6_9PSEU|nr:DEAD/DEAH box helicase family protein [Amycolatopsis arida]TDX90486.1 superfamily II DNA or RNA helicase [Amycolatopsis arida]SFQ43106.1 Superfamily II DNA or RNA helicase [Amycolatopsis arida]
MTGLRDYDFAPSYDKSVDDIAGQFYLPCMRTAVQYDRISGYFSSAVFSIAWPALKDFVQSGGRIRLICSPIFSSADVVALREGHRAITDDELSAALIAELRVLLNSDRSRKPARVLAGMIASSVVDLRIAILQSASSPGDRRLFHDKVGLFTDQLGNIVGFRGSMNETFMGIAADGNLESIDVFPSWAGGRDAVRVVEAKDRFEALWRNEIKTVDVRPVPDVAVDFIREAGPEEWEVLVDEVLAEASIRSAAPANVRPLRDHQVEALAAWELHGRRGLLEHATGSGKTYTAVHAIRRVLAEGGTAMVVVPSALLLEQWQRELAAHLKDISPRILMVGSGNNSWRNDDLLQAWTSPRAGAATARIVVATLQTASTDGFISRLSPNPRLLFVADEVHRLGSTQAQKLLTIGAPWRLGLSATPTRAGDPEGTRRLLDYFGGILQPPYTLQDAIRDRVLTPYTYIPHEVSLSPIEQSSYDELSRKLRREAGRRRDALDDIAGNDMIKKLAIARARILKRASGKVPLAARVVGEHFQPGQRWLVYCDGLQQLRQVREMLSSSGLETLEYHTEMAGNREATLAELDINGGILASVKCLDEGVDLPAVSHALILASSRNPREFVQRRGRILRRYPGKNLAFLHDAVVVPASTDDRHAADGDRLLAGELHRVREFARGAANPQALTYVERLCIKYGVPVETDEAVGAAGVEIETDDEGEYE